MPVRKPIPCSTNRILIVGDEPTILANRAVELAQWNPLTTISDEAVSLLGKIEFELVVIGQSVPEQRAAELIASLQSVQPAPRLLLIRLPGFHTRFAVATHILRPDLHPGWLLERVREMLAVSSEARILEPAHECRS